MKISQAAPFLPLVSDGELGQFWRDWPELPRVWAALAESYAVCDHLTIGHRNRGCNKSCDWWPRVEAIRGRNK